MRAEIRPSGCRARCLRQREKLWLSSPTLRCDHRPGPRARSPASDPDGHHPVLEHASGK